MEFQVYNTLHGQSDGSSADIVSLKQIEIPQQTMAALAFVRKPGYPFQAEPPSLTAIMGTRPSLLAEWKVRQWPEIVLAASLTHMFVLLSGRNA